MILPPCFCRGAVYPSSVVKAALFVLFAWIFAGFSPVASAQANKAPAEYELSVVTDRPDALYKKGETVTFQVALQHNQQPAGDETVMWTISKDGVAPIETGKLKLVGGNGTLTGKLDEPGFLHCEVTFQKEKTTSKAVAGAGVDLAELKPSLPVPDDFDAYWDAKKKELAKVPLNAKLTPVTPPPNRDGVETFQYQADSIGAPSTGYYGRPIGAKPKSLPALLFVPGAGVRSANLDSVAGWAKAGMILIDMNAHGIPDGQSKEFYAGLDAGELKDYRVRGRESRDTYYFQGVYFRILQALKFLREQPEWDGKTLILAGVSQGGGLALAGAGLDPNVTMVIAFVPGLCDHSGPVVGRIAGWPKVVPKGPDGKPDPAALETMRYYDSANFATRIKAPAHVEVGFQDVICPPTSAYVAYNNIPGKKEIVNDPTHGHDLGPRVWSDMRKLVLAHIEEQNASATPKTP